MLDISPELTASTERQSKFLNFMRLLPTQKNDIFDIIIDEGFNPKDFKFSEESLSQDEIVTYLKFKNTKYYFMFRRVDNFYYEAQYSPAERSLEFQEKVRGGWKQFSIRIKRWLRHLKRETNTVDKWETFKKGLQLIPFSFDTNNKTENFSKDELKLIALKIDSVKHEIIKLQLPSDTIKQLNAKLDSLDKKADKLSKTDWKALFIGTIFTIIFNLAIPPETAKTIWEIIRQAFKHYILP